MNPFYENLKKTLSTYEVSFHVPGHNRGRIFSEFDLEMKDADCYDTTEIPGTDNLHSPETFIDECQKRASDLFGSIHSYYLVNGTTCGIYSMMMTACAPGEQIIMGRDSHRSVYNGLILGNIEPIYLYPELRDIDQLPLGYNPESLEMLIQKHPKAKAVLITRPNYYGMCSDIEAILLICKKYGVLLLVDEAHGSHLNLSHALPESAITMGADLVVQSTHKTLPALTQSSLLHVCSNEVNEKRLKMMLQIHQSSSPSYILMNSIDRAVYIAEHHGHKLMEKCLDNIDALKKQISGIDGVEIVEDMVCGFSKDPTKLLISMVRLGISGMELETLLREEYGIQLEMSNRYYGVGIATISNTKKDFNKLFEAIKSISTVNKALKNRNRDIPLYPNVQVSKVPLSKAVYGSKKTIKIDEAIGKISGEFIIPYPPGIPVVIPGEIITEKVANYLFDLRDSGYSIIGMSDKDCTLIDVLDLKEEYHG